MARILLVDDEDVVRATLRKVLESAGHEVVEAANGEEALRLHDVGQVDLVITDIIMPEMDGFDAIQSLRAREPDLEILAVSGGVGDILQTANEFGAGDVLAKPFGNSDLLDSVSGLLGDRTERPQQ